MAASRSSKNHATVARAVNTLVVAANTASTIVLAEAIQACPPRASVWCQFVKVAAMRTSDASAKATAMGSRSNPLSPRAGNAAPGLGAVQGSDLVGVVFLFSGLIAV